ncbi:MAG TPA: DUF2142 domain-containing protein [Microbacteriaceae bacterium]|nr:DUF2142 domain-containing protein [Microbacteriaceae bacterium]
MARSIPRNIRQWFRTRKTAVAVATAIAGIALALTAWGAASPIGSSPDDNFHLPSIWCGLGDRDGLCDVQQSGTVEVRAGLRTASDCLKAPMVAGTCGAAADTPTTVETDFVNNEVGSYPDVFYAVTGAFASEAPTASVLAIRLLNVLLAVVLCGLAYLFSSERIRRSILIAGMFTLVPLGAFFIPSTNPSSWAIASAFAVFPAVLSFLTDESRRNVIGSGVVAGLAVVMGSGARVDAAIYSVIAIAGAWIVSGASVRRDWRKALYVLALIAFAFAMYRAAGAASNLTSEVKPWNRGLLYYNIINLPTLWQGAFGSWGLGWFDVTMPAVVPAVAWGAFATVLILGIKGTWWRKSVVAGGVLFSAFALPLYVLMHDSAIVGAYVQPRYSYPLLILLIVVIATTRTNEERIFERSQAVVLASLISMAHGVALYMTMKRYVQGWGNQSLSLNTARSWWWSTGDGVLGVLWSPNVLCILGALGFAAFAIVSARAVTRSAVPQLGNRYIEGS